MRINRLDLTAWGKFSKKSLDFEKGRHGFHIIFGKNEAGKSTALSAILSFLYGIESRTTYNFRHSYPSLRIGAAIALESGEVDLVRRKGNQNTLRVFETDKPFDEAVLMAALGNTKREEFHAMFGIDHESLRAGGESLLKGEGELGQLLFSAGGGLPHLSKVLEDLKEEEKAYLALRGNKKKITSVLSELRDGEKTVNVHSASGRQYNELSKAIRSKETDKNDLEEEIARLSRVLEQLKRVQAAYPLVARRNAVLAELEQLAGVVLLAEDFQQRRIHTLAHLESSDRKLREIEDMLQELQEKEAQGEKSSVYLPNRTEIESLASNLSAYRKDVQREQGLQAELELLRKQSEQRASALPNLGGLTGIEALSLSPGDKARITEKANQHAVSLKAAKDAASALSDSRAELERLKNTEADSSASGTPLIEELSAILSACEREYDIENEVLSLQAELKSMGETLAVKLEALPRWSGDLEELRRSSHPGRGQIEELRAAQLELTATIEQVRRRLKEAESVVCSKELDLSKLTQAGEIPTEKELSAVREERDLAWGVLLDLWDRDRNAELSPLDELETLRDEFEALIEQSDEVSDTLRREAKRVAHYVGLKLELQAAKAKVSETNETLAKKQEANNGLELRWKNLWSPAKIEPAAPIEMLHWLDKKDELLRFHAELLERETVEKSRRERLEQLRGSLFRALSLHADKELLDEAPFGALIERAQKLIQVDTERRKLDEARKNDIARLQESIPKLQSQRTTKSDELKAWRGSWKKDMTLLGLSEDASPAEAQAVMTEIFEIKSLGSKMAEKREEQRLSLMQIEEYKSRVAKLSLPVSPELSDASTEEAVHVLRQELDAELREEKNRKQLDDRIEEVRLDLEKCSAEKDKHETALRGLIVEAKCESVDQLEGCEEASSRLRELKTRLNEVEEQLFQHASGASLEDLTSEVGEIDIDQVPGQLEHFSDQVGSLREQKDTYASEIGGKRKELEFMRGGESALHVAAKVRALKENLARLAHEYLYVKLGLFVLNRAIARYRDEHEEPILARAGEIFRELTAGSFISLRPDFDDKGSPIVVAERAAGSLALQVPDLSDGARDQLYLALRLACVENYLEHNEPVPFILDDVLIHFDDERARAALSIFAQLAKKTQVLFFTHHEHLWHLAEEVVGADALRLYEI